MLIQVLAGNAVTSIKFQNLMTFLKRFSNFESVYLYDQLAVTDKKVKQQSLTCFDL